MGGVPLGAVICRGEGISGEGDGRMGAGKAVLQPTSVRLLPTKIQPFGAGVSVACLQLEDAPKDGEV